MNVFNSLNEENEHKWLCKTGFGIRKCTTSAHT